MGSQEDSGPRVASIRQRIIGGRASYDYTGDEDGKKVIVSKKASDTSSRSANSRKGTSFKVERKTSSTEVPEIEKELGLGDYFRYLIIILILIAIITFFGIQLNSILKSMVPIRALPSSRLHK